MLLPPIVGSGPTFHHSEYSRSDSASRDVDVDLHVVLLGVAVVGGGHGLSDDGRPVAHGFVHHPGAAVDHEREKLEATVAEGGVAANEALEEGVEGFAGGGGGARLVLLLVGVGAAALATVSPRGFLRHIAALEVHPAHSQITHTQECIKGCVSAQQSDLTNCRAHFGAEEPDLLSHLGI
jgi:hypothetical protein